MNESFNNVQSITPTTEDLKAKYGKLYKLSMTLNPDDDTEVVISHLFKKPNTASYDRYIKTMSSGMTRASKAFLQDNIVEEHRAKLEEDLEEYPALAISAAEKLLEMLGLSKTTKLTKV